MDRNIIPIVFLLFIIGCEKTIDFEKLQDIHQQNNQKVCSLSIYTNTDKEKTNAIEDMTRIEDCNKNDIISVLISNNPTDDNQSHTDEDLMLKYSVPGIEGIIEEYCDFSKKIITKHTKTSLDVDVVTLSCSYIGYKRETISLNLERIIEKYNLEP